jgi:GT2 family glycosyltransferase
VPGVDPGDVSLYIPVRNAARTLPAALRSLRAQTVQPRETFLVLDLRSTDDSIAIARASGLRIVEQAEHRFGHARNLALQAARTPWLASCDADVELEPSWLAALLDAADPNVAIVGGCTHEKLITPADRWRAVNMPHNWGPAPLDNPFMLVSEMLARVDALRTVGGYVSDGLYGEDSDLCRRLRDAGFMLRYQPAAVAHHDRRDTIASVLDLRWNYAQPRQQHRLTGLPGLVSKLPINRSYALQTLSQTLHSRHPQVCAISLLLWFHHARTDLAAVLNRWPLLDAPARDACLARLADALLSAADAHGLAPAAGARTAAARTPSRTPLESLVQEFAGAGIPSRTSQTRESVPAHLEPPTLAGSPGFASYLDAVGRATADLLAEIPQSVADCLQRSAEYLCDDSRDFSPLTPILEVSAEESRFLAAAALSPAWTWPELCAVLREIPGLLADLVRFRVAGRSLPAELPPELEWRNAVSRETPLSAAPRKAVSRETALLLLPHLEADPHARQTLALALSDGVDAAAIAYRTPSRFLPAVPILSARDLAIACAAAGFVIRDFHAEAGYTRLVLQRR